MRCFYFIPSIALSLAILSPAQASQITIKGSDTMVVLCQKWADAFIRQNPGVQVQVTGGGSGTGLAALLNGTTDIAASSRPIKSKEVATAVLTLGSKPEEIVTGLDGIGVFVNAANPVKALTMEQLDQIFIGKITNWKSLGGPDMEITVYSRENNSGTYAFFKEHVLKEKDFTPKAQTMAGTAALISAIASDKRGIGYGGIGYAAQGVRIVPVAKSANAPAVEPSEGSVSSGDYPVARELYLYANPKSLSPETRAFLAFVRGLDGQAIVKEVGFYPLSPVQDPAVATPAGDQQDENAVESILQPVTPPVAGTNTPAGSNTISSVNQAAPSGVMAVHLELTQREVAIIDREVAIARREAEVAMREKRSAEREAESARREAAAAEAEASIARREASVALALGLAPAQ